VRPRRRKARRLEQHGQNGFEDCVRLRDRDGLAFRQSRFRYASREDQYDGDYDTGSERKYGRNVDWDDQIAIILIMAEMGTASMATHKHLCDRPSVSGRRSARLLFFTSSIHA